MDNPIEIPIDGVLDLHTFNPRDVKELVPEFLAACLERGIFQVRIIHGKGQGTLRQHVHSMLSRHPQVESYTLDYPQYGGWGATIVRLLKPDGKR
jgi:DNA-nicking Smr family endonuclease